MNAVDDPETSESTNLPLERVHTSAFSESRKIIGIGLVAILLLFLLFAGVHYGKFAFNGEIFTTSF